MVELDSGQRETWGSRSAFVLAAVGSAVGLGNLWKFPYMLHDNGGAAFLIPYVIAVFLIGVPMLILEFSMGHFSQRAAPDAFAHCHKRLEPVGWWGILLGFVIILFYPVILAYCFSYLGYSVQGILNGGELPWAGTGIEGVTKARDFFYQTYLGQAEDQGLALGGFRWHIVLTLVLAWIAMYFCIFRGVNLVGKIVWLTVPLPWLMLLVLTVNGLMLPGSVDGLAYYLNPDWSQLAKPTTWQYAFGQAFFSLSLAFGVMLTYASFLHRRSDLNNNAAIIGIADFATSFIAGLAIFSTLGAMAYVTAQHGQPVSIERVVDGGPGLAFVAFPYALAQLPGSAWWSFVFFFTLVTLGIDSAFSITESVLMAVVDRTGWPRRIVLPAMSAIGLAVGLVFTMQGGLNWLGVVADAIDGTWGIAFVGLLECLVLGWLWRIDYLRLHANDRSDWNLGLWWDYLIRVFIPLVLASLFAWSLFGDLTAETGFLRDPAGRWILSNCVGLGVAAAAPVLAIGFTLVGRRRGERSDRLFEGELAIRGRAAGALMLLLALISAVVVGVLFGRAITGGSHKSLLWISLLPSAVALVGSDTLLRRYNRARTEVSWLARWAGLLATLDIGVFIALQLIYRTRRQPVESPSAQPSAGGLSTVSYVILAGVFLVIICGLGWCFYRAIVAASRDNDVQHADQVGDAQE